VIDEENILSESEVYMKILRTGIIFLLIGTLLSGGFVLAAEPGVSGWAADEISEVLELGFIPDNLQNQYSADITRSEFAEAAVRFLAMQFHITVDEVCSYYLNLTPPPVTENGEPFRWFSDVDNVYVTTAYLSGIVKGRGNGIFDPDSPITREEAAQMLYNTYRIYAEEDSITFADLSHFSDRFDIASWAENAAAFVVEHDVMRGISESEFSPQTNYTREQCYVTFLRLYRNAPCSRLYHTAKNLWTYDEMIEDIINEYSYVSLYTCETETCTVLYGVYTAARTNGHRFWIVYKDGGRMQLREEFLYPDHVFLENFVMNDDGTELYCTQKNTGEHYKINLEKAEVEILP